MDSTYWTSFKDELTKLGALPSKSLHVTPGADPGQRRILGNSPAPTMGSLTASMAPNSLASKDLGSKVLGNPQMMQKMINMSKAIKDIKLQKAM
ncbi:hypothetical protein LCGC14_0147620 [marine sediment metagenome]|uniref:Uncharacterized protein n=1 Tax=marine sediment metagenome TaxID=412755 RepID=A0A0F9V097_9ZZZZ